MSDKPIIFSGPMVRAILDGRKTMTRRVLKPQPVIYPSLAPSFMWGKYGGMWPDDWFGYGNEIDGALPYVPGDVLWVREGWKPGAWRASGCVAVDYRASPEITHTPWCPHVASAAEMAAWFYEAIKNGATETGMGDLVWPAGKSPLRWRSPIHMPRWASRITLRVMGVKVERLQYISEADAVAEGCLHHHDPSGDGQNVIEQFSHIWQGIHGPRSWDANPWVAAITFEKEPRP